MKKKQSKARKKLESILAKLLEKEDIIKKTNDVLEWNELLHDLEKLLKGYEKDLPKDVRQILEKCVQYTDTSPDMLTPSYEAVKTGIGQAISGLPLTTGGISTAAIVTIIVIGVVAAGATVVLITQTTQLTIKNYGCNTVYPSNSPVKIPGFAMPNQPIPSGSSLTMDILPIEINIDSRVPGTISLSSSGMSTSFQVSRDLTDLKFDKEKIFHQLYSAKLQSGKKHELIMLCG